MVPDCELSECASVAMRQHLNRLDQVGLWTDDVVVNLAPQYHVEVLDAFHGMLIRRIAAMSEMIGHKAKNFASVSLIGASRLPR